MDRRRVVRLVYGTDPSATLEGEEIALLVLDEQTSQLLGQMRTAKTWGEAFAGFGERLDEENRARRESEVSPRLPDDPFDIVVESEPESGVVYRLLVETEYAAAKTIADTPGERLKPLLDDHVRFETGMVDCFRCYLRNDESAFLVSDLLRDGRRGDIKLTRDDELIALVRALES